MWINLQDKQKSIQRAWSQSNTVDGSISCINQCVDGGGGPVICPCWWGALSGLTLEPGPSSITGRGTYIVFCRPLRLLYDQQDPDTVCLWRHTSYPDPAVHPHPSCSHPSIHFPLPRPPLPIPLRILSSISPLPSGALILFLNKIFVSPSLLHSPFTSLSSSNALLNCIC